MRTLRIKRRPKLPGGSNSELTKLKLRWRAMPDEARAHWQEKFATNPTHAELRALIAEQLQIHLQYDQQMSKFRKWELDERERELEAERQAEDERQALAVNPGWSLEQARKVMLKKAYQRAMVKGDFALGLATLKQDLNGQKVDLNREKFQFDAVNVCRKHLPELKEVEADESLTEAEKTRRWVETLFGKPPANTPDGMAASTERQ